MVAESEKARVDQKEVVGRYELCGIKHVFCQLDGGVDRPRRVFKFEDARKENRKISRRTLQFN